jgi:hypothetical protein
MVVAEVVAVEEEVVAVEGAEVVEVTEEGQKVHQQCHHSHRML